ncbi:MAG TPA: SDR family NAD(P)-dependent oxidoreductase [Actinomycetota bacterium]|nr:SDR family NAD(P)-dependent oxidoreductase [Actinomycetota bacterium]
MNWHGSVAFITGASRGIGREVVRMAAAEGAQVGLISRSEDELRALLSEVGGRGSVAVADVADRAQTEDAVAKLVTELGPADILVNNAGIGSFGAVADTDVETFERLMEINYLGTVYATKAVLPGMLERRRGHIVNVASIAGRIGAPLEAAYSATKFAVVGFSEALAIELAPRGIGVSMVNPGPVETEFFAARGHPYQRKTPKPLSAKRVAEDVITVVERNKLETYLPRWLRQAVVSRVLFPPLFKAGTLRAFKDQLPTR